MGHVRATLTLLAAAWCGRAQRAAAASKAAPHPPIEGKTCDAATPGSLFAQIRMGAGHGDPCGAIQLTPTSPELVWTSSEVSELAQLLGSHPVRELDLSGSVLGDANAALLAEGLAAALAKGCRRVRLDRVHLGNDGLSALSRAATRALGASEPHFSSGDSGGSVHGAELSLADNKINDVGGGHLSSLLLRHLARLDLSGNALTDRMARLLLGHIRTSPLRELDLSRNEISLALVEKLRSVRNRSGQRVHVKAAGQRAPGSEPPAHHRTETPPPPPAGGTNYDSGRWHAGMLPWKAAKESIAALQSDGLLEARHAATLTAMGADHEAVKKAFAKYGGLEGADTTKLAQELRRVAEWAGSSKELRRRLRDGRGGVYV